MAARKEVTLSILSLLLLVVLALVLGTFFRTPKLDNRPMHTDEAILATKTAEFWETGHFDYSPKDYHGPALHQVSWLWGHISGWMGPETWSGGDLRGVSVVCGVCLLLVTLLYVDALGRIGTGLALLMMAVSPIMVFYSRYYIMEMLLVLLVAVTLGCFWRCSQGGTRLWLVLGGAALGFQHATKETFILNVGAAVCGWVAAHVVAGGFQPRKSNSLSLGPSRGRKRGGRTWLWVAVPAVLVSVAAFSGGFQNWAAVRDSVLTYGSYFTRSGGSGHEKDFLYYFGLLFWHKDTVLWTELLIGGFGLVGMLYALVGDFRNPARQAFLVFLSVYTLALFTVYSLIPYKTPWCILSAHYGLILLAGVGAGAVWTWLGSRMMRIVFNVLLAAGLWHLCNQTSISTGMNGRMPYEADQRNPYVYSHTSTSLLKMLVAVDELRAGHGDAFTMQVINRDSGWPLPWYWRNLKHVGYHVDMPAKLTADCVVVEADLEPAAVEQGYERAKGGLYGLRPQVTLVLMQRKAKESAVEPAPAPAAEPGALPAPLPGVPEMLEPKTPPPGAVSPPAAPVPPAGTAPSVPETPAANPESAPVPMPAPTPAAQPAPPAPEAAPTAAPAPSPAPAPSASSRPAPAPGPASTPVGAAPNLPPTVPAGDGAPPVKAPVKAVPVESEPEAETQPETPVVPPQS